MVYIFANYYSPLLLFDLYFFVVSPRLECQHYGNLTDASRFWDANIIPGRDVGRTCQDSLFTKQWTRFLSQNGTDAVLADNCPSVITDIAGYMDRPPCGAMYRGWIKGSHPTEEGGNHI